MEDYILKVKTEKLTQRFSLQSNFNGELDLQSSHTNKVAYIAKGNDLQEKEILED